MAFQEFVIRVYDAPGRGSFERLPSRQFASKLVNFVYQVLSFVSARAIGKGGIHLAAFG